MAYEIEILEKMMLLSLNPNVTYMVKDICKMLDVRKHWGYKVFSYLRDRHLIIKIKKRGHPEGYRLSPELLGFTPIQMIELMKGLKDFKY